MQTEKEILEKADFKALKSRVLEANSAEESIVHIESFLQQQLTRTQHLTYLKPLAKVFQTIEQNQESRVESLAETACLSEREFRHFAGMSPTAFIHYLEQVRSKGYLSAYKSYHNPEVVPKM